MVTDFGIMMFNLNKSIMNFFNWQYTEIDCLLFTLYINCILLIVMIEICYIKGCNEVLD